MADKLTQQITDALTRAAARPGGLPLYAGKSEAGLFPATSAGKTAAQKCLSEGLIRILGTESRGKTPRELFGLTETGWNYLLAQVNPKQVLEDFVRVLETRGGEVEELLDLARRMAENLQGLKDAVARVLPSVLETRIRPLSRISPDAAEAAAEPEPAPADAAADEATPLLARERFSESALTPDPDPAPRGIGDDGPSIDLAVAILAQLDAWSGTAGEDCPLPRLFDALTRSNAPPTIGEFHDVLRQLHVAGAIYLHPWTGPLYALPEPAYALLAGHNIAYYASRRHHQKDEG